MKPSVLLADDHAGIVGMVSELLAPDYQIAGILCRRSLEELRPAFAKQGSQLVG